jgi:glycerol-3-phosphate dehydrogenase
VTGRDGAEAEIVVVGGGIRCAQRRRALAAAGHSVLLLERDEIAVDSRRGEGLVNWGLEAARQWGSARSSSTRLTRRRSRGSSRTTK